MLSILLYLGPGIGAGTIVLVFAILAIVVFSFGYVFYLQLKAFVKRIKNRKK